MTVTTVGELIEELKKHDPAMPLRLEAQCYTHEGRVFTQIRPNMWNLKTESKDEDGNEVVEYKGIEVQIGEEELDFKAVKRDGKWKYEYRKYLVIENNDTDEMEMDED